jgi:hypothetical protein
MSPSATYADGSLDTIFGDDGSGIVTTDVSDIAAISNINEANSVVVQNDGKIVVAMYIPIYYLS